MEEFKLVLLKTSGVQASFYLVLGQKKESIERCIASLFGYTEPIVGLVVLDQSTEEDAMPITLIPLELLSTKPGFMLIDPSKTYRPHFWLFEERHNENNVFGTQNSTATYLPPPIEPLGEQNTHAPQEQPTLPPRLEEGNSETKKTSSTWSYDSSDPWQNWEYFYQYGKLGIHTEMLKDESRTRTYRDAILSRSDYFKGKTVMDVGAGTGILSFFCVFAGAELVYAVEASSLADWTELVVAENGLSHKIKVVKSRVEDLALPKVDIIVSEWMGTFLIFESMLESVLFARDQFLKPKGVMFPSQASIYLAPILYEDFYAEKISFWSNVYDVNMSAFIPFAKKCAFEKPIIDRTVKPEQLLAPAQAIATFDLKEVTPHAPYQKTVVQFSFEASKPGNIHGFAAWFDVQFQIGKQEATTLSTSPNHKDTHWHQDLFLFDNPTKVAQGDVITGMIRYQRNPQLLRHLIIDISFSVSGTHESKTFYLWGNE